MRLQMVSLYMFEPRRQLSLAEGVQATDGGLKHGRQHGHCQWRFGASSILRVGRLWDFMERVSGIVATSEFSGAKTVPDGQNTRRYPIA